MKIKVEMPTQEMLKQNPCCMKMLQDLVKLKKHRTIAEWVSLAGDYHANTKADTHIKILKIHEASTFQSRSMVCLWGLLYVI